MSTYTQIYYHVVFSTKDRVPTLRPERREDFFRYTWGILKNKDCHLYRIGGVEDHVHLLTSLHPTVSLADLVKDIKISTSKWTETTLSSRPTPTGRTDMAHSPFPTPTRMR